MKSFILTLCFSIFFLFNWAQGVYPPDNLKVDSSTLVVTWKAPSVTLLEQNFESDIFPPVGWQERSTHAVGWFVSQGGSSRNFPIPEHSRYAIVNDDAGGEDIDGCCEYLITPELDLSTCPNFVLRFDSYFTGNYGQSAFVEMSTDGGVNWTVIKQIESYPNWHTISIDLAAYSGYTGLTSVVFAFHANDNGNQASGWAIDNVIIQSTNTGVTSYDVLLNQTVVASTDTTSLLLSPSLTTFRNTDTLCVVANYTQGIAASCEYFSSSYLPFPLDLQVQPTDTGLWFSWQPPVSITPIVGYYLYENHQLLGMVAGSITQWFKPMLFGSTCIEISALHDLSTFGYPSQYAESAAREICGRMLTGFDVPFSEDFTTGNFVLNKWLAEPGWAVDGQNGSMAPCARFDGGLLTGPYNSQLISWHFNSMGFDPCPSIAGVNLELDIKLSDQMSTQTEYMVIELLTEYDTTELKRIANSGSFNWKNEYFNITQLILDSDFQIRFRAEGQDKINIEAWYIDNVKLSLWISDYYSPPSVNILSKEDVENRLQVYWNDYYNYEVRMDDGSWERSLNTTEPGNIWYGNKFETDFPYMLKKVKLFFRGEPSSSAIYTFDIFDLNRNLLASSQPFDVVSDECIFVNLPDVYCENGFYGMIHIESNGLSDAVYVDTDGFFADSSLSYVYDGVTWTPLLQTAFGPGVFSMIFEVPAVTQNLIINPCGIVGYEIFRKDYSMYPPGPNSQSDVGEWIGSVPYGVFEYVDRDLDNSIYNCYKYTVNVIHNGWPESGSNWECIYVSLPEINTTGIRVSPNPAHDFLLVELEREAEKLEVINAAGVIIKEIPVSGKNRITLDACGLMTGLYVLKVSYKNKYTDYVKIIIN